MPQADGGLEDACADQIAEDWILQALQLLGTSESYFTVALSPALRGI